MQIRSALAGAVLATVALAVGSHIVAPAHATTTHQAARQNLGDPNATYWPLVAYPVGTNHGTGAPTVLAVDAPHDAWGQALRRFGRYVNTQHLGVRVLVHRTCSEAPSDPCVALREDSSCSDCGAETSMGDPSLRVIDVAASWASNTTIAYPFMAHEFGHVLGLEHHDHHGVDGAWPNEVTFSNPERQALIAMYAWKH